MRKGENKNYRSVPTRRVFENSKEIAKKFKNLKNTVMYSFQAKIGLKKMRRGENKNYLSVPFLPDAKQKIPKKQEKKFKKLKNIIMASFQAEIGWKRMRKRENKNYHYVSFLPDA